MKRLTLLLLSLSVPAWADIAVTPGSGKTVATETNASREYQVIELVGPGGTSTATFTAAGLKVDGSAATQPVSGTVGMTGFPLVPTGVNASTVAVVNGASSLTVQPGNTANTTAWKVDGSAVTQPVSGTFWQVTQPISGTVTAAQTTAASLKASVLIDGTSNTMTLTGFPLLPSGVNASTVAVRNDGTTFNVTVNAALPTGTNNIGTVSNSTVTVLTTAGGSLAVAGTLADNGVAAATNRVGVLPGIAQTSYNNGTGATQGRNVGQNIGTDGLLWTASLPAMRPASYSASTNTITLASTPSDIVQLCGNANNTVLVYNLRMSCTQTTAGTVNVTVLKRSSADVGAYSTMTAVAQDSNYQTVQSTAVWFTANPTVGTIVGHLDNYKLGCIAPATASPNDIYISPASWRMKPIVLRGAAQCIAVNLENVTVTGGAFTVTLEWIETATITP